MVLHGIFWNWWCAANSLRALCYYLFEAGAPQRLLSLNPLARVIFSLFFCFSVGRTVASFPKGDSSRGQHLQAGRAQPKVETVRYPVLRGHEGAGGVRDGRQEHRLHQEVHR